MSKETHMNIVAAIMFATGKATSIKAAVHLAAQVDESVHARLLKDSPQWAKVAKKVLDESEEPNPFDTEGSEEEE